MTPAEEAADVKADQDNVTGNTPTDPTNNPLQVFWQYSVKLLLRSCQKIP